MKRQKISKDDAVGKMFTEFVTTKLSHVGNLIYGDCEFLENGNFLRNITFACRPKPSSVEAVYNYIFSSHFEAQYPVKMLPLCLQFPSQAFLSYMASSIYVFREEKTSEKQNQAEMFSILNVHFQSGKHCHVVEDEIKLFVT